MTHLFARVIIAAGLAAASPAAAWAGAFPAEIDLSTLDGANGFILDGADDTGTRSGNSVSAAGDVNGDGFGDIIIGAPFDMHNGNRPGAAYVVFGTSQGFPAQSSLSTLDGVNGFAIAGVADGDRAGFAVSGAGDVNGDGFADVLIEATYAGPDGFGNLARGYVVFGAAGGFPPVLQFSALNGANGFAVTLPGPFSENFPPLNISDAGDVNGDGFGDIVFGAPWGNFDPFLQTRGYVVFGAAGGFAADIDLSTLDGTNGFIVSGIGFLSESGTGVSSAGDVNADGFDDLLFGATFELDDSGQRPGKAYVIYGGNQGFPAILDISALDGANGFALVGTETFDGAGHSVSDAGDVNGDGVDDIIIAAPGGGADPAVNSDRSYIVFGNPLGFPALFPLSSLDGTNGFTLLGPQNGLQRAVSGGGDVNGDGIADVILGAPDIDLDGLNTIGRSYVLFGSGQGFPALIPVASLDGTNGFTLNAGLENDGAGYSVSDAGDVNGDGIGDIVIGAPWGLSAGGIPTGQSYVVFGRPQSSPAPVLTASGICPGQVTISVSGATPGGKIVLLHSDTEGTFIIPRGNCTGTVIDLANPLRFARSFADETGTVLKTVMAPPPACGRFLQIVDEITCTTSNIAILP